MNSGFKIIGSSLLLILGIGSAFAQSGSYGNRREAVYFYAQEAMPQQGMDQQRQADGRPSDRRPMQEFNNSGFSMQGNDRTGNLVDPSRRQGKLSPEQRRDLRRQIDEAGHDLYSPRR